MKFSAFNFLLVRSDFWLNEFSVQCTDAQVFFCLVHRERAWNRWLKSHCSANIMERLLRLMRAVALSTTVGHFEENLQRLRNASIYDERVASWFEKHWVKHCEVNFYFLFNFIRKSTSLRVCAFRDGWSASMWLMSPEPQMVWSPSIGCSNRTI